MRTRAPHAHSTPRPPRGQMKTHPPPQTGRPTRPRRSRPPVAGSRHCREHPTADRRAALADSSCSARFAPDLDKICETSDRDVDRMGSLTQMARAGARGPLVWSFRPGPKRRHEGPRRIRLRGPSSCPGRESGRRLGDDQGNWSEVTASFRKLTGDPDSGNQRPKPRINPPAQPHAETTHPH